MHFFWAICPLIGLVTGCVLGEDDPVVRTSLGWIRGLVLKAENGRNFNAFLGIPYAEPPLGRLRFSSPIERAPWAGILNATEDGPTCLQKDVLHNDFKIVGSEDCLYLNVYVPKLPHENDSYPYPVLIWIHGGSWLWWSGSSKHFPPERLMNKDLILVSVNYRLGWFGFLSTEDEVVRGNNGLKDQAAAIRWIKTHISAFGGDPDRITLDGQDTGATSAHLHTFSPLSKDFISGIIVQSGSAFDPRALHYPGEALKKARLLATAHSCPVRTNLEMIACLREVDAKDIASSDALLRIWDRYPTIPLKAVVEELHEDAFLVEHPESVVRDGNQAKVPMMIGNVADEAVLYTSAWTSSPFILDDFKNDYRTAFPAMFAYEEHSDNWTKDDISDVLWSHLFSNGTTKLSVLALRKALSMRLFERPVQRVTQLQHGNNTIYVYRLGYRGSTSFSSVFGGAGSSSTSVCHYDDLRYLFDLTSILGRADRTRKEEMMVETISEMWYNFVATGDPTPETTELLPAKWKPVDDDLYTRIFVINDAQNFSLKKIEPDYVEEEQFWDGLSIAHSPDYRLYVRANESSWKKNLKNLYARIKEGFKKIFG